MKKNRLSFIPLFLCACLFLCGAGWFSSIHVAIDTEKYPVYVYRTADKLISDFDKNEDSAKEAYDGTYVLLSGQVTSVGKNGKNIVLSGTSADSRTITCSYEKALRTEAQNYVPGNSVAMYGRISVDTFDKDIHIAVESFVAVPVAVKSNEMYYLQSGQSFDKRAATKRTLNNGSIQYLIPSSWKEIEYNIKDEKLGSIEGYQYVLNSIPGNKTSTPEAVFVCYFNNETQLTKTSDKSETKQIEMAIINNILGDVGKFPSKEVDTYYGAEYTYYLDNYRNSMGDGYNTEFVFQKNGDDGIVMVLYVYGEAQSHLSDVMFLTRFIEIKDKK